MTDTEEDFEVIPIEVDVSVDNDEFEPAPDEDEEYEVEEILNKRIKKGETEYLVKWKGGYIFFQETSAKSQMFNLPCTLGAS